MAGEYISMKNGKPLPYTRHSCFRNKEPEKSINFAKSSTQDGLDGKALQNALSNVSGNTMLRKTVSSHPFQPKFYV